MPSGNDRIDVLDHGFVRLVDRMGSDLAIVRAARVSYNAAWRAGKDEGSDSRLIRYLWKNAHCVTPHTRVLTRDLKWAPAGDLKAGDGLIGFDEHPGEYYDSGKRRYRSYRECKVIATGEQLEEVWVIEFKDGSSVKCTGDHRWLAYTRRLTTELNNGGTAAQWERTDELASKIGRKRISFPRPMRPWATDESWGAGFLAGAWDADGSLTKRSTTSRLCFSQYDNSLLHRVIQELNSRGFATGTRWADNRSAHQTKPIASVSILGGYPEAMRFIGSCRPPRMLGKWAEETFDGKKILQAEEAEVASIRKVGVEPITLLSTSTETYLAEGFMAHNTSPFEAVEFQFEVKAPIFVFRQWHRHRTWSFNELSARYRELPEEFYVPDPGKVGEQSTNNKQGRQDSAAERDEECALLRTQCVCSFEVYKTLLACGWPRELARSVLPLSTYSHMFAKVDLRNLLHFLDLRLDEHAQYEIREYARAMLELARPVCPVAIAAWESSKEA